MQRFKSIRRLRGSHWGLIAILLLAFYLRAYGLGQVAFNNDESQEYNRLVSVSFRAIMANDAILNYQALALVLARASILLLGDSLFSLRWPSLGLSVLGVALIYTLSQRLLGRRVGLISALLLALSPYSIFFGYTFRGYTGLIVLPLLVYLLALLALQTGQWRYWIAQGLTTAAMIYTHLFTALAWLNLILFVSLVWFYGYRFGRLKRPSPGQLSLSLSITVISLVILYAPVWLKVVQATMISNELSPTGLVWVQSPEVSASIWYNLWLFNGYWQEGSRGGQGAYLLLGLMLLGLVAGLRQGRRWQVLIIFAWAMLPFIEIWLAGQIFNDFWVRPNYVGYTLLPILILAAVAIAQLPNYGLLKRLPPPVVTLLPVILFLVLWYPPMRELYQVFAGADWQAVGNFLRENSSKSDLVVCQRYDQPWQAVDADLEDLCTRTLNYRAMADVNAFSMISTAYDLVFNILPDANMGVTNRLGRVWLVVWGLPETSEFPPGVRGSEFNHFGHTWVIQADRQKTYVANLAEALTSLRTLPQASDQQFSYNLMIAPLAAAGGNTASAHDALDLARTHQPDHPESAAKLTAVEQLVESYAGQAIKNPLAVNFGDEIILQGYELNPLKAAPGSTLNLTLFWQALGPIKENYTIFLHLRDATGHIIAQFDFQPFDGNYPTQNWQPGQSLNETRQWSLPANFPSGQYNLLLGFYNPDTLERLPVVHDQSGENAFYLTSLWVD